MLNTIKYEDLGKNDKDNSFILIDLRSPSEYRAQTIPGAINIPIFNDEERAIVGTIYKKESIEKAKRTGVKFVSEKLPDIYEKVSRLNKLYNKLIFFCARGGLRSGSLVSLLHSLGIGAFRLDNGYKGYRRYINNILPKIVKDINFLVLYGNTGVGKTNILKVIRDKGLNVLDLEGCANHRGSVLGGVGLGEQNSQKMFESLIYESLDKRNSNTVFVEGESKKIGRVMIPTYIYKKMKNGININIKASMEKRVGNILKDYVHNTDDELIESLNHLRYHMSNNDIDRFIQLINQGKYEIVIEELMRSYYDPLYRGRDRRFEKVFYNDDKEDTAGEIIEWVKEKGL